MGLGDAIKVSVEEGQVANGALMSQGSKFFEECGVDAK